MVMIRNGGGEFDGERARHWIRRHAVWEISIISTLSERLFDRLLRKSYRDAYVAEHVRTGIAMQIRAMRDMRGWQQKELAKAMKKPQSVLSRIEDPDYGKPTVQTLLEVASAFDVALLIQFVSYPEFLRRTKDVSTAALDAASFDETDFTCGKAS
jgi:transcriptional regulator with XRE-family HTH domain